jgi:hypothetical protein
VAALHHHPASGYGVAHGLVRFGHVQSFKGVPLHRPRLLSDSGPPVLAQKLIQPWNRFADKTATDNSCIFELSVSCCCDVSALQEFGALWHSREAIADRDDPLRRGGCAGSVTANNLRCATLVAMVQTADLREGDNGACRRRLYGPRVGTILG